MGVIEVGYYLTIADQNLKARKDISGELRKLCEENKVYLFWHWDNGFVGFDEGYFKWDEDFLQDLLCLKSIGVRGYLTAYGEEGEYYKYVINNRSVKEYHGSVIFPKKPRKIIKRKDDIKKPEF